MKKGIAVLVVLLIFYSANFAQHSKITEDKIDPALRLLINKQQLQDSTFKQNHCGATNEKGAKGRVSKNSFSEKRYECIIYTKNAMLLKDKGIVVNSTLPAFVTARVTFEQIEQMASMPEVTYIKASKVTHLQ